MAILYNIWGISDSGYQEKIKGNLSDSDFSLLKDVFSDKARSISFDYAASNPNDNNFYSIERRHNKVIYTIYRTNWKRGNRLAYDAVSLLVDSNKTIKNALGTLKTVMNSYVTQKEKGFSINLDNTLQDVIVTSSKTRGVSKKFKCGYIKYSTDLELSSSFLDNSKSLANLNKVYFFTSLPYLESGKEKIINRKEYMSFRIKLVNYNSFDHVVKIDGVIASVDGGFVTAYPDARVEGSKKGAVAPYAVVTAGDGKSLDFPAKKPPPPIQKRGKSIHPNTSRKKKRKKQHLIYALTAVVFFALVIVVLIKFNDQDTDTIVVDKTDKACHMIETKGGFLWMRNMNKKFEDPVKLYECFEKKGILVSIAAQNDVYKLVSDASLHTTPEKIINFQDVTDRVKLKKLRDHIISHDGDNISNKVIDAIDRIINYQRLINDGFDGVKYKWKWENQVLISIKKSNQKKRKLDKNFYQEFKYDSTHPVYEVFQEPDNKLPASVYREIDNYLSSLDPNQPKQEILGCTDKRYEEYNRNATEDDGSCKKKKIIKGCTDPDYQEYRSKYTENDGSCKKKHVLGCRDDDYQEYNKSATKDDGSCKTKIKTNPPPGQCTYDGPNSTQVLSLVRRLIELRDIKDDQGLSSTEEAEFTRKNNKYTKIQSKVCGCDECSPIQTTLDQLFNK